MCCLFGFVNYSGKKLPIADSLTNALAQESTLRGVDSTGIAYNKGGKLRIYKRPLSAYEMTFKGVENAVVVSGHTRHATQGSHKDNYNNHPFPGCCGGVKFALSHNGVLWNDSYLRRSHGLPETKVKTDSFIAVQLLESYGKLTHATVAKMCEAVSGSFSFTMVDNTDALWIAKGDSPLTLIHFPRLKLYAYASTTEILFTALCRTSLVHDIAGNSFDIIEVKRGDIFKIDCNGDIVRGRFKYDCYSGAGYDWRCYGNWNFDDYDTDDTEPAATDDTPAVTGYEQQWYNDLVAVAISMGYSSDDIDELRRDGYSLDEIEDFLYQ